MRFGPWLPLNVAADAAPHAPGVMQARADSLLAFPSGKSAMVYYAAAPESLRSALAQAVSTAAAHGATLIRFAETPDPQDALARLLAQFVERFGAPPPGNAQ